MKESVLLRVALWLAEQGPRSEGEAFAGDLLEEVGRGSTPWWCVSQAFLRVLFMSVSHLRGYLFPVWYCGAFVVLFPFWQELWKPRTALLLMSSHSVITWPGSAILVVVSSLFPAVLFVWTGLLVFVLLKQKAWSSGGIRIMLSFSFACCMVCAETMLGLGSRPAQLSRLSNAAFYYPLFHAHFSLTLFLALLTAVCLLPRGTRNVRRRRKVRPFFADLYLLRLARGFGLILLLVLHAGAQEISPKEPAAKRLVQLIASFNSEDWSAFHADYVTSFVSSPPDVPMGNEAFRQGTGGFDLRKLEEDTPTHATVLVQEHNSDQFARISLEMEAEEPHRIVQLRMGPIDRPAEFPYGTLTDAEVVTQARTRVHALADRDQFSGVIIIQHDGRTVYSEAVGEADRSRHIANTLDTRFRIGSMNKMFTAVATLQLVAAGKLGLDTPIGHYLPDYPNKDAAARVTVRHLLTHTGGTGDFFGPEFDAHRKTLRTHEDYVALFGPRPLRFQPGSRFEYSNYGFLILGAIIDHVSGQSYYQYVHDHVYTPAGMSSTGSEPEDVAVPRRAIGYTRAGGGPIHADDAFLPYRGASAGGGYTTAGDLLLFARALQDHKLLDAKDTRLLLMPSGIQGGGERYGLGFGIDREPSGVCFGHSGGSPGQAAILEICPQVDYTMVWLANTDPPAALPVTDYLLHRLSMQSKHQGGASVR